MAVTTNWTSRKASAETASKLLSEQIALMEERGWELVRSDIVQAGRSKRSWIFLGLFNFLRGKQVQATATFRYKEVVNA